MGPPASGFLTAIMRPCLCHSVGGRIFSWQGLGNEQQMCVGHLVSVEEAPSVMCVMSWPEIPPGRTNQTDGLEPPTSVHCFVSGAPLPNPPAELLEVSIWEQTGVWHLTHRG